MLVAITNITAVDADRARVWWTSSDAALVSWVFVAGRRVAGPIESDDVDRSAAVAFPPDQTVAIEVHDLPEGIVPVSTYERDNTRPYVRWARVAAAARYRIYRQPQGGDEALISDRAADSTQEQIAYATQQRINGQGGQWQFYRVESVDAAGNESTRAAWPYLVMEPPAPVTLTIAHGSGANLFDVSIGV